MTRTTRTPAEDDEVVELHAQVRRLQARIAELEGDEQSTRPSTRSQLETAADRARDNTSRAVDEASNLLRGVTLASLEAIRTATDAVSTFVDEVYDRNRPDEAVSMNDLARQLPGDIINGFAKGVERAMDAPGRAADTLSSTYRERPASGRRPSSSERSESERRSEARQRSESEQDRIKQVLGRPVTRVILDAQDRVILNVGEIITNQAIAKARLAGVLDILFDSAYQGEPQFTTDQLRAPKSGSAALEEEETQKQKPTRSSS
jgi:hypothetical protein